MPNPLPYPLLSPRCAQVLDALIRGLAEKQVATELGISPHTVHVYVKAVYRHFGADSRAALLGRIIKRLAARLAATEAKLNPKAVRPRVPPGRRNTMACGPRPTSGPSRPCRRAYR